MHGSVVSHGRTRELAALDDHCLAEVFRQNRVEAGRAQHHVVDLLVGGARGHIMPDGPADAEIGEAPGGVFLREGICEDPANISWCGAHHLGVVGIGQLGASAHPLADEPEVALPPPSPRVTEGPSSRPGVGGSRSLCR